MQVAFWFEFKRWNRSHVYFCAADTRVFSDRWSVYPQCNAGKVRLLCRWKYFSDKETMTLQLLIIMFSAVAVDKQKNLQGITYIYISRYIFNQEFLWCLCFSFSICTDSRRPNKNYWVHSHMCFCALEENLSIHFCGWIEDKLFLTILFEAKR